jgi:hypothetical protein
MIPPQLIAAIWPQACRNQHQCGAPIYERLNIVLVGITPEVLSLIAESHSTVLAGEDVVLVGSLVDTGTRPDRPAPSRLCRPPCSRRPTCRDSAQVGNPACDSACRILARNILASASWLNRWTDFPLLGLVRQRRLLTSIAAGGSLRTYRLPECAQRVPAALQVSVSGSGQDRVMAEDFLHFQRIHTCFDQMRGIAVAQAGPVIIFTPPCCVTFRKVTRTLPRRVAQESARKSAPVLH